MLSFQNSAEGFLALKQGKIDAYSQDAQIMASVAGNLGEEYEAVGGAIWSPGLYGIGVPENESDWRDKISFILQDMLKDGTYEKIYQKWFGPKGHIPASDKCKTAFAARYLWQYALLHGLIDSGYIGAVIRPIRAKQ